MFPLSASNEPPEDIYPEQARNLEFSISLSKNGSTMSRPKFLAKLSQLLQTIPCAWCQKLLAVFFTSRCQSSAALIFSASHLMNTGFLAADIRSSGVQTYYPLQWMLCNAHFPGTRTLSESRVDIVVSPISLVLDLLKQVGLLEEQS
jgi:hypothetical protein